MHDIKSLGNEQLGLHYEVTQKKINDIQTAIIDDITNLLGIVPIINDDIYNNPEKFHIHCKPYLSYIEKEKKEILLILIQQEKTIDKEIKHRQTQMLKEIGIITPSIRVMMIVEQTRGKNFPLFDNMIKYIKLVKKGEEKKRPKNKKIYAPIELIKTFENLGTSILTVLSNNLGPIAN